MRAQRLKGSKAQRRAWRLCAFEPLRLCAFALFLAVANAASACPFCWGNPNDPMVKSANNGIWVLLGVVGFVQIGFAALFITFWRRAREQRRFRESLHVIEGGPLS